MTDFQLRLILWPFDIILLSVLFCSFVRIGYLVFKIVSLNNMSPIPNKLFVSSENKKKLIFSIKCFFISLGLLVFVTGLYYAVAYLFNIPIARH